MSAVTAEKAPRDPLLMMLRRFEPGQLIDIARSHWAIENNLSPARTPFKLRVLRMDGDGLTLGIDHVTPAKAFSLQARPRFRPRNPAA